MMKFRLHRLKLKITQIIFLASCLLPLASLCFAQPISSTELITNPKEYDGKEIVYEGEVIGEVMPRRQGVWVNVNDGDNSLGVWMSPQQARVIDYKGSYKTKGDILRIKGIFHYACPEHGGDLDIHANSVQNIKSGWQIQERMIPAKRSLLIILIVILCLILILRILINK
jgi:hypothetical protein